MHLYFRVCQALQTCQYLEDQELQVVRLVPENLCVPLGQAILEHHLDLVYPVHLYLGLLFVPLGPVHLWNLEPHLYLAYLAFQIPQDIQLDQAFQFQVDQADLEDPLGLLNQAHQDVLAHHNLVHLFVQVDQEYLEVLLHQIHL